MIRFIGLQFSALFDREARELFEKKQKYVDSEVLRLSDPYVPLRTGDLKKSGISGTVIGSGIVKYTASHARPNYYLNAGRGIGGLNTSVGTRGLRGKYWFERMKADHKREILQGLNKIG